MAISLLYEIYRFGSLLIFLVATPFLIIRQFFFRSSGVSSNQRLGFFDLRQYKKTSGKHIWLHAASVGEVRAAKILIDHIGRLIPDASFVLSTMTIQGKKVAQDFFGHKFPCIFAPVDVPFAVRKSLKQIQPDLYICLETELWPNMIEMAHRKGVRLLLTNGRLSERSFRRYRFIVGFMKRLLGRFSAISVINAHDAERYTLLGAQQGKVFVHGNAKYDMIEFMDMNAAQSYRKILFIKEGQQVLVGGSTHKGEESILLEVFTGLRRSLENLILILAPRHLHRLPELRELLSSRGINFDELSSAKKNGRHHNVILVDSMGELNSLYSIGTLIFCGGSLVERGGHNIMEAASWGKPVHYGPFMKDFSDAAELLESVGAGIPVHSASELQQSMLHLAKNPDLNARLSAAARGVALSQQGSARRQAELVKTILFDMEQKDESNRCP